MNIIDLEIEEGFRGYMFIVTLKTNKETFKTSMFVESDTLEEAFRGFVFNSPKLILTTTLKLKRLTHEKKEIRENSSVGVQAQS